MRWGADFNGDHLWNCTSKSTTPSSLSAPTSLPPGSHLQRTWVTTLSQNLSVFAFVTRGCEWDIFRGWPASLHELPRGDPALPQCRPSPLVSVALGRWFATSSTKIDSLLRSRWEKGKVYSARLAKHTSPHGPWLLLMEAVIFLPHRSQPPSVFLWIIHGFNVKCWGTSMALWLFFLKSPKLGLRKGDNVLMLISHFTKNWNFL